MATSRISNVRTPGVIAPPATEPEAVELPGAPFDDGAIAADEPEFTLTQAQLDAAIAKGIAKGMAMARNAEQPKAKADDLPDQSEVDIDVITTPTLSKQGYVVPRNSGVPAGQQFKG